MRMNHLLIKRILHYSINFINETCINCNPPDFKPNSDQKVSYNYLPLSSIIIHPTTYIGGGNVSGPI